MQDEYEFYDEHFERRGRTPPEPGSVQPLNEIWLPYKKDAPILDVGCGWGERLLAMHKAGYTNLTGVDVSQTICESARRVLPSQINVIRADAIDFLSEHKEWYRLITAFDIVEHLPKEKGLSLCRAAHSALKPGGTLVVHTFNASCLFSGYAFAGDFTHKAAYTGSSLIYMLRLAGFSDAKLVSPPSLAVDWKAWRPWKPWKALGFRRYLWLLLHRMIWALRCQRLPMTFERDLEVVATKAGEALM